MSCSTHISTQFEIKIDIERVDILADMELSDKDRVYLF